jgi:hypothetical protein
MAEGFALADVDRAWPPPLVRCEFVDLDPGQESFHGMVTGLTTRHVVVVASLDAVVMVLAAVGFTIWHRRSSERDPRHRVVHA